MRKRKDKSGNNAVKISTTIPKVLWLKAVDKINWSECLVIGITTKLSQSGDKSFNNAEQLRRKIAELKVIIGTLNTKILSYSEESEKIEENIIEIASTDIKI
jgi:hypothetical protein